MSAEKTLDQVFEEHGIRKGWTPESKEAVIEAMKEYANQKCEEQRQICFDATVHSKFGWYKAKKDSILNASTPEL